MVNDRPKTTPHNQRKGTHWKAASSVKEKPFENTKITANETQTKERNIASRRASNTDVHPAFVRAPP